MSNETAIASLQEKIDELNQQAWEIRVTDLPKAFELSQESVKLARSIDYPKGLAEGLRSLGFSYVRFFKNDEAAPLLKESLSLFQSLNDLKGQAVIYEYLGIIERNWGNLGASLDLLLKANEIILQTGPPELEITCSYQLGVTHKHLGNHENALDYLYKTVSLAKKINYPLMEAYATNIIGSIHFDNGNYNQALDCYQQGLTVRQQSNDKWGEAGSLDNIGFTYLKLNDLDKAIDYCKQSLAICQGSGDKKGEANALLHLAEIYEQAGHVKQAAGFSNESLEIRKARGDKRGETEVLLFLADLYKNRNDVEDHQIFEWLSGALKIADEIKAQDLLSKAHYNLHEYYQQKGNFKESLVQLEAHFQIEKELHKNSINQKVANLEISHKAEVVSQRNKELTELNEKIEKANEELRIEASLERVRAVAMGMKKPDDLLSICEILFAEFQSLGFSELRNTMIDIFKDDKRSFLNYDFSGSLGSSIINFPIHDGHPVMEKFAIQIRKSSDAFAEIALSGNELESWKKFRKSKGDLFDPKLEKSDVLYYYFYSVGTDALGISTFKPVSTGELDILKRFRNVFELAYKRYTDIEKAEAQAREARIEAALEKIRSRSLAMHKSDELKDVITVVFEKLKDLGLVFEDVGIHLFTEGKKDSVIWVAAPVHLSEPILVNIPYSEKIFEESEIFRDYWMAKEKGENTFNKTYSYNDKNRYFDYLEKSNGSDQVPASVREFQTQAPGYTATLVTEKHSALWIDSWSGQTISIEGFNVLKRVARVFEQAYTRFLDLQKAEAQARESQIQLALERVRARTMAMQHSDELKDAASLLFKQLEGLGIKSWSSGFNIWEDDGRSAIINMCNPDGSIATPYHLPHTEEIFFIRIDEARQRGDELLVMERGGKDLEQTYNYMFSLPEVKKMLAGMEDTGFQIPKFQVSHCAFFSQGYLMFITYEPVPDMWDVFKRFAKVFEQTYTRFLDLQKAEAQARESQIQLALERVRARTMAMQRSDELADVAQLLFQQVKDLGIQAWTTGFNIWQPDNNSYIDWITGPTGDFLEPYSVELTVHPTFSAVREARLRGDDFFVSYLEGEQIKETYQFLSRFGDKGQFQKILDSGIQFPARQYNHFVFGSQVSLMFITYEPYPEAHDIFKRFGKVFEQTYTRFLDLQKAEAQARESQIELALERVRARTMAMQKSDELREAVLVIYEQLQQLNFESRACNIIIIDKDSGSARYWVSGFSQEIFPESYSVPYLNHPYHDALLNPWKQGDKYVVCEYTGQMKQSFDEIFFTQTEFRNIPEEAKKVMIGLESVILSTAFISYGALQALGAEPLSEEKANILKRFAKVFEQTYTRFLDLQKAEAQSRESQIQLALERVRARTMAMQKSEELMEAANLLFQQVQSLGISVWSCGYNIWEKGEKVCIGWMSTQGAIQPSFRIPLTEHRTFIRMNESRLKAEPFYVEEVSGEELADHYRYMFSLPDFTEIAMKQLQDGFPLPLSQINHVFNFKHGNLIFLSAEAIPEAWDIFKRFTAVFEQTYTRFLDLQKSEAQAREAHIEAALEKVRSRSLAMHNANELGEVVTVLVEKLKDLGVVLDANGVILCTYFQNSKNVLHWIVSPDYSMAGHYLLTYFDHPILNAAWQSKENGDEYFSKAFSVEEKNSFFEHAFEHSDYRHFPDEFKQWIFQNDKHILSFAWQKNSAILIPSHTGVLPSEEDVAILKRFSKVFEQSYVRFLDLQKAEVRAREAQIEASLERIRAKAMAMHRSEEIDEVLEVLFDQFDVLGIVPMSTHLTLINLETNSFTFRETGKGGRKSFGEQTVPIDSMDIWKEAADRWRNMEPLSLNKLHFPKESLPIVWQVFHESFASMPEGHKITPEDYPDGIYHTAGNCKFGYIGMNQVRPASEEEAQIVLKFAVEFGRLYQRYLDLQKAEAQTKEARIEAALERVRSRTMGMQKSEELKDVIQVIYEQFVLLNIYIEHTGFVMDYKARDDYDIWIADQLGVPSHVTIPYFDSVYYNRFNEAKEKGEDFFATNLDFEEKNRFYKKIIEYVPGLPEETKEFLFNIPGLAASTVLLDNVCLYIENFSGIPYSDEENKTLMRFGKVFQQTYTRFNDLKLAEAHAVQAEEDLVKLQREKKRAEDALSELQVTQKQLIQSEKMASLGELTAGIAHEIQNPLNFVNNFSDVNKELLIEMKEEIEKGNIEEVKVIANDIISNEEKINHHGKRADAIVKGMLQHSRSSSGVKEPTDINELADEYLRLAYHGLRAKDKSFNATMKTDFDEAIGKVNVIPQEIGRVFLNLITNAFYAVSEKKAPPSPEGGIKNPQDIYEPTVTIKTLKNPPSGGRGAEVVISVKDNGNGIPKKILDKIFQPFFTTKPTGQGTGLGLSLSYDIVKAHSGEIKVKTKDGEGSEFVIQLPIGQ